MTKKRRYSSKGSFSQFIATLMVMLQCAAVTMLIICAASVWVSPADCSWSSIIGLCFPFALAGCIGVGVVALLLACRTAWISLLGLLLCCLSIRDYCPVNLEEDIPADSWHVMTWNLGATEWNDSARNALKDYLRYAQLDLLCMQEFSPAHTDTLAEALKSTMPYSSCRTSYNGNTNISIISRWPIVRTDSLLFNEGMRAMAFHLLLAPEDTLIVVNCHLRSMHLSGETRSTYHSMVKREETNRDTMENVTKTLFQHVRENSIVRSAQVDTVAQYIHQHKDKKILVMGDMNDTPISYTRHTLMRSADLTDCYRATGNGIGRTFNRDAIYVRIDHIMCSTKHFRPYRCQVGKTLLSDHNPVDTYIQPLTLNTK